MDEADHTDGHSRWRWRQSLAAVAAYAILGGAYTAAFITLDTSWEHHPFAGPLVALTNSRQPADFVMSLAVWAGLGVGLCWPAFPPSVLAGLGCAASVLAWVGLGVWAACAASC